MPASPTPQPTSPSVSQDTGTVWLIGAGPGDPGLITVEGQRRLRQADVVVYDALANPRLLDQARPDAIRLDVGKCAQHHKVPQDDINALLVQHARAGRDVARLKGGDPYLFGRGGEEALYCAQHGVPCGVLPGVTAGIAAPAAAGIPVTHRKLASTVTFVTGHEDPQKTQSSVDYPALATLIQKGGTACFYMAVARLGAVAETLVAEGLPEDTASAVVQWGTLPNQNVARGPLSTIADQAERQGVGSPAIVVVGAVAALEGITPWPGSERGPLSGQTIVVTRTRTQQSRLAGRLRELGADVLEAPAIRVVPPEKPERLKWAVGRLRRRTSEVPNHVVLTSANAVDAFADALFAAGQDARWLSGISLSVVGSVTRARLRERLGLNADVMPATSTSEALGEELLKLGPMSSQRFFIPRADVASPVLPTMLREAGAEVLEVEAYRVLPAESLPAPVLDAFAAGRVDWVTFTSTSIASSLTALLGPDARDLLGRCKLASIGSVTSASMRGMGLTPTVEAPTASVLALADAIAEDVA